MQKDTHNPQEKSPGAIGIRRFPVWKQVVIALVIVVGCLYALPNLYPDRPALQIAGLSSQTQADDVLLRRVSSLLDSRSLAYEEIKVETSGNRTFLLVAFANASTQLQAQTLLLQVLGEDYVVALNSAETTPQWLRSIEAKAMKLGLDLQGGVHFLLQVDVSHAVKQRLEVVFGELRTELRKERLRFRTIDILDLEQDGTQIYGLEVGFADESIRDQALPLIRRQYSNTYEVRSYEALSVRMLLPELSIREIENAAIQQNLITLRNRVNELGVAEPLVQRQGNARIVVELPGVQDTATAKKIIGATANLEFRLEAKAQTPESQTVTLDFRNEPGRARLEKDIIVTGKNVVFAQSSFDENGRPQVNIELDGPGGSKMTDTTRNALQRRMAVVFIEFKNRTVIKDVDGEKKEERELTVEKGIISLATIQGVFASRFRITGLRDQLESSELALLLRAGSLAAPVYFVEERTVGPSLGEENIRLGINSLLVGMLLVLVFMAVYYRLFGMIANFCLLVNLLLLVAVMSALSATLTLPGIAGIVLTVGMVVDSNVIIFSRIREELKAGRSAPLAADKGFSQALVTIIDANITTLLVAVILFAIGTGPIKGFAITLSVGIICSLFCSIMLARFLISLSIGKKRQLSKFMFIGA